jgi:hypothetical protein
MRKTSSKSKKKYVVKAQIGTNQSNNLNNTVSGVAVLPELADTKGSIDTEADLPSVANLPYAQARRKRSFSLQGSLENPLIKGFNAAASGATAIANSVESIKASRNEFDQYLKARQGNGFENMERYGNNDNPAYFQAGGQISPDKAREILHDGTVHGHPITDRQRRFFGAMSNKSKYQVGGQGVDGNIDYSDPSMDDYSGDIYNDSDYDEDNPQAKAGGKWIQKAVNPAHKGYCTPMTKSTCTPRRKALARTFKKHHGFHQMGGNVNEWDDMGWNSTYDDEDQIGNLLAQTGGQFSAAEQVVADRYTQLGYNVTKDPTSGQLKFEKNGVVSNNSNRTQTASNQVASQAATGNPQAPASGTPAQQQTAYPDKETLRKKYADNKILADQNRYNWGNKLDTEFLEGSGGTPRQAIYAAAQQNKVDPTLLYSSAMEEGMSGRLNAKNASSVGSDYPDKFVDDYPVDGFYNYGLDQFADNAKSLEKKGYLPKGFSSRINSYKTKNEKDEPVNAAVFKSDADAVMAKSAMMRQSQDQLNTYTKKTGVKLTPAQQNFFLLANYNGGEGNMQKMIQSYQDKGYLKNDDFVTNPNFKPASYGSIYSNVQARLQSAKQLKDEGFFKDYSNQPPVANQPNGTQTAMQVGGELGECEDCEHGKMAAGGHWIQGAIKHPGRCSNPGDSRCPKGSPQYNLAMRFKHGDLHHQFGGVPEIQENCVDCAHEGQMKAGGLSRSKDYGSKSHPYPMVKSSDFAGGHRSYPIPTRADARDALRLAGLHHRADVKAKVYAKYPDLRKQMGGIGHDLFNGLSEYEIDNNTVMQAGGIQQVGGLPDAMSDRANVEAEKGEVYTDRQGNMNQVDPNGATHEQGGEMLPDVHRVLENTSRLRGDKVSKYLKLTPDQIKALTGIDTNRSMSHAEAMVEAEKGLEKERSKIVKNIGKAGENKLHLDNYAQNSVKLNMDQFAAIPTKEQIFDRLFNHQELVKGAMGINNDGSADKEMKYGGFKYKAQTGVVAYPGNTSGQTTPAGNSDAFAGNLDSYLGQLKRVGVDLSNVKSNKQLQSLVYNYALQSNPQAIRNMWQEGIQNFGYDKAAKEGLVYDKDDASKGIKRGQFKPGVLDDPKNLQKLADLYPDNLLGVRLIKLAKGPNSPTWTDDDLPPAPAAPQQPGVRADTRIRNTFRNPGASGSEFKQPLQWYDLASPIGAYVAGSERLAEKYNPTTVHQLQLRQLNPQAALNANQSDFNAAVQAVQNTSPNDVGLQLANISNLTSRKYALNNQVIGNYENQNAQIKNNEIQYNTQARDRQSLADQQARETFEEKVLTGKAKQQEQKLTALDSLYKTVAENAALNRNGNLILKLSRAFDQYGNYNGYQPTFTMNGAPPSNPYASPSGKPQPAGGIQGLTPGKNYYNRRTGKTMRFDGTSLVEVK